MKKRREERGEKSQGTSVKEAKDKILNMLFRGKNDAVLFCKPTALFSLNELPALLYEVLVRNKTGAEIEDVIIRKIVEQQQRLKDYTVGNKSLKSFVPKNFTIAGSVKEINLNKLKRVIHERLKETDEKADLILKKERELRSEKIKNPNIKRSCPFKSYELGQEAAWIANDIKFFMPKEVLLQWRGRHHINLQKALAYYDFSKEEAKSCVSCFWNLKEDPFIGQEINEAFEQKTFVAFYRAYLSSTKEMYNCFLASIESSKTLPSKLRDRALGNIFQYFNESSFAVYPLSKQKESIKSTLFLIPRGVFDDKPTFIKGKRLKDNPEAFADWYQYANDPKIEFQRFYDIKRDYSDYFEEQQEERQKRYLKKEESKRNEKSREEIKFIYSQKEDMIIKKVQMNDVFLKLIADSLFNKVFDCKLDKSLKDIYHTKEERAISYTKSLAQSKRELGNYSRNIYNESFLWGETVPFCKDQLKEERVVIKNIGKYSLFVKNEKVKNLFSYDESRMWTMMELENELRESDISYEVIRREQVFKEIQQFEKFLYENHKKERFQKDNPNEEDFEELATDYPNFRTWVGLAVEKRFVQLFQKEDIKRKTELLIVLRNRFAHNEFPSKSEYDEMIQIYPKVLVEDLCSEGEVMTYSRYFQFVIESICKELQALYNKDVSCLF